MHSEIMRSKFGSHCAVTCAIGLLVMFHCSNGAQGTTDCKSFNFNVAVDDYLVVYINGKLVTGLRYNRVESVELNCSTQVIALLGLNSVSVAGIRGSDESGYILTNSSWKCTNVLSSGWAMAEFDDSSWPSAVVSGKNNMNYVDGIRNDSQWIWTKDWDDDFFPVYCRKTLHHPTGYATVEPRSTEMPRERLLVVFYTVVAIIGVSVLLNAILIVILIFMCSRKNKPTKTGASSSSFRNKPETGQTSFYETNNGKPPDATYEQLSDNDYNRVYTDLRRK